MDYIITGAGSGMGRATAVTLAENPDNRVILIGRDQKKLNETLSLMNQHRGHLAFAFDVRQASGWTNMLSGIRDLDLHGLFANAGIGGENQYGKDDRWDDIISINLTGTYISVMECLPWLKRCSRPFRNIVITSSCLARFGVPRYTAYCTSKTGLLGLTRSLAVEHARDGILVNALCPGWVHTDMAVAGIQKLADASGSDYQEEFDRQMDFVPTGKISEPQEIANMVKFLFSNEQTSMTGQGIDINNGSYMI
jgi:NAD(P)-dependent dehydrogenase (short-subunit alcohol dehydrogenase family)